MPTCDHLNCYASNSCCKYMSSKQPYCQVASQCNIEPVWQAIVIPAVLFLLAVCLIIVVVYKLRTKRFSSMQVKNFARQEMYLFIQLQKNGAQTLRRQIADSYIYILTALIIPIFIILIITIGLVLSALFIDFILMGGGESRSSEKLRFVEREWEVLREEGGMRLLRNLDSEKEVELVPLMLDTRRDFEKECDIYNYRRMQENALVGVYAVQNSKGGEGSLCGSTQVIRVALQRTVKRWGDIEELPFPESLYALSESIRGFDDCFHRIGLFQVSSRMIALNSKGSVRVWLNQNFADNHPADEKPQLHMICADQSKLKSSREELIMLQNLLNVIEEKCEGGRFPEDFRAKIYAKSNFVDAYNQVQLYCRERNLELPDRIAITNKTSRMNTNNSNFVSKVQNPVNTTFGNNYEPRETLIKNLSFSQANYIESPQLRKYDTTQTNRFGIQNLRTVPYPQIQSPRYTQPQVQTQFGQPQSGQTKFNYQPQQGNTYGGFQRF